MTQTQPGEAMPSPEPRSSVEIHTSTRGTDVGVKVYVGSPLGDIGDQALTEYARLMREIERQQMNGWAQTVGRGG
jgi:hypothetical protein